MLFVKDVCMNWLEPLKDLAGFQLDFDRWGVASHMVLENLETLYCLLCRILMGVNNLHILQFMISEYVVSKVNGKELAEKIQTSGAIQAHSLHFV
jgi:hypothetical protein